MDKNYNQITIPDSPKKTIVFFEKYLTIRVALGILFGIGLAMFSAIQSKLSAAWSLRV